MSFAVRLIRGCLRRSDFFPAGKEIGERKPPKGTFVVADLMDCGIAVCVNAAIPCEHSVAPPLPNEAYASPGLWEMRFPLESLPDGERGSAPFDPQRETQDGGREFCTKQWDQVTCAGMQPPVG